MIIKGEKWFDATVAFKHYLQNILKKYKLNIKEFFFIFFISLIAKTK